LIHLVVLELEDCDEIRFNIIHTCYKSFNYRVNYEQAARTCIELGYDGLYSYVDTGVRLPENGSWIVKGSVYHEQNQINSKRKGYVIQY